MGERLCVASPAYRYKAAQVGEVQDAAGNGGPRRTRWETMAHIREALAGGEYRIPAALLAEAILRCAIAADGTP